MKKKDIPLQDLMKGVKETRLNQPKATLKEATEQAHKVMEAAKQGKYLREHYPNIYELGAKVYWKPYPHIPSKELKASLKKHKINPKKFNAAFGVNTCLLLDNGDIGLYLVDIERALKMVVWNYKPTLEEWD